MKKRVAFLSVFATMMLTTALSFGVAQKEDVVALSLPELKAVDRDVLQDDGFNLGTVNEADMIERMKESGEIPEDATWEESYSVLSSYLRNKNANYTKANSELEDGSVLANAIIDNDYSNGITSGRGSKTGQTDTVDVANGEVWDGSVRTDKVLVLLVDFSDYKHNSITPGETGMYYPEYTKEHYENMIFGEDGYTGPNGENFASMKQYYEEQSGGSYTVEGTVAGWYTASNTASYYGGNVDESDSNPRQLVYEALVAAAADPSIDLSEFDQEDRYDMDGDGNLREPDGIIDHLMVIHAGVGEEAGGGSLGEDAVWSHRWNLGGAATIPGTTADVDYWGGTLAAYDYTIEPEDGAMGVFAHEYGHDLGLPDEYDTRYTGNGEPVSSWSIMANGSWAGRIGGTKPTSFSPYAKEYLQSTMPGSNWFNPLEIYVDDLTETGTEVLLDQSVTKGENYDAVKVNLPSTKIVNTPKGGHYEYSSGYGNGVSNMMYTPVDLTNTANATLTFNTWYEIEEGWDYASVVAYNAYGQFLGTVSGDITTTYNPYGQNPGHGITGFSNGWQEATFDLSQFAGEQVFIGFLYWTDAYVAEAGFYVDDVEIVADGEVIFNDGAESASKFALAGFTKVSEGTVETDHYYLVEWRNHQGSDAGLNEIYAYNGPKLTFEPGMLVWYVDNYYTDNWVGAHPGHGFNGVVDGDQHPLHWTDDDSALAITQFQIHDATFSLNKSEKYFWDFGPYGLEDHFTRVNPVFDDSNDYSSPETPHAGRKIPMNNGLKIRVIGESEDRSVGKILIYK